MENNNKWVETLSEYSAALQRLNIAVDLINKKIVNDSISFDDIDGNPEFMLLADGVLQRFCSSFQIACIVIMEYATAQGHQELLSENFEAISYALESNIVTDSNWHLMDDTTTIMDFNYEDSTSKEEFVSVLSEYHNLLREFELRMIDFRDGSLF